MLSEGGPSWLGELPGGTPMCKPPVQQPSRQSSLGWGSSPGVVSPHPGEYLPANLRGAAYQATGGHQGAAAKEDKGQTVDCTRMVPKYPKAIDQDIKLLGQDVKAIKKQLALPQVL